MSLEAAQEFRDHVNGTPSVQAAFADALARGPEALSALACRHGFEVSPGEAAEAVAGARNGAELSDHELELVSAGGDPAANIGGGRYS